MEATNNKRSISIFYAWQSDLASKYTRQAIKKSLRFAAAELEDQLSTRWDTAVEIIIDEATRDIPGAPISPPLF